MKAIHLLNEKDILRKDAVWFTQKRSDGSTELYSLADFNSSVFPKNCSVINAYKSGKLGAVPHTGSIYISQSKRFPRCEMFKIVQAQLAQ